MMKTILVLVVAAAVLFVAGCGSSEETFNVSERFSAEVGAKAVCMKVGFKEVAAEREMTYTCSYGVDDINHSHVEACVFVEDGEFYVTRMEAC